MVTNENVHNHFSNDDGINTQKEVSDISTKQ